MTFNDPKISISTTIFMIRCSHTKDKMQSSKNNISFCKYTERFQTYGVVNLVIERLEIYNVVNLVIIRDL